MTFEEKLQDMQEHIQVISDTVKDVLPANKIEEFEKLQLNEGWENATFSPTRVKISTRNTIIELLFDFGYKYRLVNVKKSLSAFSFLL